MIGGQSPLRRTDTADKSPPLGGQRRTLRTKVRQVKWTFRACDLIDADTVHRLFSAFQLYMKVSSVCVRSNVAYIIKMRMEVPYSCVVTNSVLLFSSCWYNCIVCISSHHWTILNQVCIHCNCFTRALVDCIY